MSLGEPSKKKAEEFIALANKKLNSWGLFSGTAKYEEAADYYTQAAAQYKIAKMWNEAGDCYIKASDLHFTKTKSRSDAVSALSEAGKAYKQAESPKAIESLMKAANCMMEDNRFSAAGKIWSEIAEIQVKQLNNQAAIDCYTRAADCYKAENSTVTSQSMMIKVADLLANDSQYERAIKIYEEIAKAQADSSSVSWAVKDYCYKALICLMVIDSQKRGMLEFTLNKCDEYCIDYVRFDNTKEATFIRDLCRAFNDGDEPLFTQVLVKYNNIFRLDEWSAKSLYKVKQILLNGGKPIRQTEDVSNMNKFPGEDDEYEGLA